MPVMVASCMRGDVVMCHVSDTAASVENSKSSRYCESIVRAFSTITSQYEMEADRHPGCNLDSKRRDENDDEPSGKISFFLCDSSDYCKCLKERDGLLCFQGMRRKHRPLNPVCIVEWNADHLYSFQFPALVEPENIDVRTDCTEARSRVRDAATRKNSSGTFIPT